MGSATAKQGFDCNSYRSPPIDFRKHEDEIVRKLAEAMRSGIAPQQAIEEMVKQGLLADEERALREHLNKLSPVLNKDIIDWYKGGVENLHGRKESALKDLDDEIEGLREQLGKTESELEEQQAAIDEEAERAESEYGKELENLVDFLHQDPGDDFFAQEQEMYEERYRGDSQNYAHKERKPGVMDKLYSKVSSFFRSLFSRKKGEQPAEAGEAGEGSESQTGEEKAPEYSTGKDEKPEYGSGKDEQETPEYNIGEGEKPEYDTGNDEHEAQEPDAGEKEQPEQPKQGQTPEYNPQEQEQQYDGQQPEEKKEETGQESEDEQQQGSLDEKIDDKPGGFQGPEDELARELRGKSIDEIMEILRNRNRKIGFFSFVSNVVKYAACKTYRGAKWLVGYRENEPADI